MLLIHLMLRWLLCGSSPKPTVRRVVPVIVVTLVMAIFGTVLVVLTPDLGGPPWLKGTYVLFVVVALKLPLLSVLWWLIARNPERPGGRATWHPDEQAEILTYLDNEAARVRGMPDAVERLEYLSQEAWHVADRLEGEAKVDALTVALRVDLICSQARRDRSQH